MPSKRRVCCVCENVSKRMGTGCRKDDIILFAFPNADHQRRRRTLWKDRLFVREEDGSTKRVPSKAFVCSDHFDEHLVIIGSFSPRLDPGALPNYTNEVLFANAVAKRELLLSEYKTLGQCNVQVKEFIIDEVKKLEHEVLPKLRIELNLPQEDVDFADFIETSDSPSSFDVSKQASGTVLESSSSSDYKPTPEEIQNVTTASTHQTRKRKRNECKAPVLPDK